MIMQQPTELYYPDAPTKAFLSSTNAHPIFGRSQP